MMSNTEKNMRERLELKANGNGNFSIMAGAGGGKTTLLGKRICKQIIEGTPIEEFVVITYTNAAAAELREKISQSLQNALDSGTLNADQSAKASDAINALELMQISTIHSFLLKILRECSFESGIALDAKMLEGTDEIERRDAFFRNYYNNTIDQIRDVDDWRSKDKRRDYKQLVYQGMFNETAGFRGDMVYETEDHILQRINEYADAYVNKMLPIAEKYTSELNAHWVKNNDKSKKKCAAGDKSVNTVIDLVAKREAHVSYDSEDALKLSEVIVRADNRVSHYTKDPSDIWADADEAMNNYINDNIVPLLPKDPTELNYGLYHKQFVAKVIPANKAAAYVDGMRKAYQEYVDEKTNELSNDEILYRSQKLLTEHRDILEKYRKRYSKIYVDEFQDTTALQANIIKMLAEEVGSDPDDFNLQDDKLIVVGDPKQSIYRFTGAEVSVYNEFDKAMDDAPSTSAEAVKLDENFRSNSTIVNWVNEKFRDRIDGYSDMHSSWDVKATESLFGIFNYIPERDEKEVKLIPNEIDQVVDLVQRLVGDDHYYLEKRVKKADTDGNLIDSTELHKIQYKDIMIITKWGINITNYVECFAKAGIPVNIQGKIFVAGNEVLESFVSLVEYLSEAKNKRKRITAYQVISGLDLTQYEQDAIREEWDKIWTDLRDNNISDSASVINYLLMHEEYYLPKNRDLSKEQIRDFRIKLHQMTETCLQSDATGLAELAQAMREYMNFEIRHEISLESNANAVRLMNCHQAKGLTGQIVIICDRTSPEKPKYSGFRSGSKYYASVSYKVTDKSALTVVPSFGYDYDAVKKAGKEEIAEAIRLEYVAATRAEHALILMPPQKEAAWFTDPVYDYDNLNDILGWLQNQKANNVPPSLIADAGTSSISIRLSDLSAETAKDYSPLKACQFISITPSSLEIGGQTGYTTSEKDKPGYDHEDRPSGNVFGTVMHRTFELLVERRGLIVDDISKEEQIKRAINQAVIESYDDIVTSEEDDPISYINFLHDTLTLNGYLDKILALVDGADEVYTEYDFSFYVSEEERTWFLSTFDTYLTAKEIKIPDGTPIWINGQADLIVKKGDNVTVYDYKSDARNGKPLKEFKAALNKKYAGQLQLYKYAIDKSFENKNIEVTADSNTLFHLYI